MTIGESLISLLFPGLNQRCLSWWVDGDNGALSVRGRTLEP